MRSNNEDRLIRTNNKNSRCLLLKDWRPDAARDCSNGRYPQASRRNATECDRRDRLHWRFLETFPPGI